MTRVTPIIAFGFLLMMNACTTKVKSVVNETVTPEIKDLKEWQETRVEEITASGGWMSLAGLYWLKEGKNTFGSNPSNQIVFPENAPATIGIFELENGVVNMTIEEEIAVKLGADSPKSIVLVPDKVGNPTTLQLGSMSWYLIQRENRFGIRLKDSENPKIKTFKGIEHFPYAENWKVPAELKRATNQSTITLRNVIDMDVTMKLEGYLHFKIANKSYRLEAMDGGEAAYFIIFADETTGMKTYGAGRYLYVPKADVIGKTVIDFNKAHNPPCAFTDFATCPLPSVTNRLDLSILAGEKDYH